MANHKAQSSYLASTRAVELHRTFVSNVFKRLTELALLWPDGSNAGRPKWDELSRRTGIPRRTLENLIGGANQPTLVGAAWLAKGIGVPLDSLMGQEGFGITPAQAIVIDGNERGATTPGQLECVHPKRWLPNSRVCQSCLDKFQSYQRRLRELYEAKRAVDREQYEANQEVANALLAADACPHCGAGVGTRHREINKNPCPNGMDIWKGPPIDIPPRSD